MLPLLLISHRCHFLCVFILLLRGKHAAHFNISKHCSQQGISDIFLTPKRKRRENNTAHICFVLFFVQLNLYLSSFVARVFVTAARFSALSSVFLLVWRSIILIQCKVRDFVKL